VAYSPNGTLLATAGYDDSVIVWNTATLKVVTEVKGNAPIAFAPCGTKLVVRDVEATLKIVAIGQASTANAPQPQSGSPLGGASDGKAPD
jgi:hypothetical protein